MGVRGTDFFISQGGRENSTEVSIIRGAVELTPRASENQKTPVKPIELKTGFSAEVSQIPTLSQKPSPSIEVRKTTQEDLTGIQETSKIKANAVPVQASVEIQKSIQELEKKATTVTLKDIKTYDKALYATLEKQGGHFNRVDDINQAAIVKLIQEAPKAPPKRKPYQSDLKDTEDGAYDKYFKNVDP
jgi:hypothetical protein